MTAMPVVESPASGDWQAYGACQHTDLHPDAWFPITGTEPETWVARQLCRGCPVRQLCTSEALAHPGTQGIWGGLDEFERREMEASCRK